MLRTLFLLCLVVLAGSACTSSNATTQPTQSNPNYDAQYREQTRSSTQYETGEQPGEEGDPPITTMLVAMETGDVHPGEDYFVYTVVDKPVDRTDVEYVWSVSNGDISEVPEAERGRLTTQVDQEYATLSAALPPAAGTAPPTGGTAPPPGASPPAGGTSQQPITGAPPATGTGPGTLQQGGVIPPTGTDPRTGSGAGTSTGAGPTTSGEQTAPPVVQGPAAPTAGTGTGTQTNETINDPFANRSPGGGNGGGGTQTGTREKVVPPTLEDNKPEGYTIAVDKWNNGEALDSREYGVLQQWIQESGQTVDVSGYTPGDGAKESPGQAASPLDGMSGLIKERRVVGGQTIDIADKPDFSDEDEDAADEDASEDEEVELSDDGVTATSRGTRDEPLGAGNVVEGAGADSSASFGSDEAPPALTGRGRGLRGEYQTWQESEVDGEGRRRALGGYGIESESEALDAEESYEAYTFTTDEPFMMWTPSIPGSTVVYVKVMFKDEQLTDPMGLPVEVRLQDPEIELVNESPDIVAEGEPIYLRIDGTNVPDFVKGLLTVTFDNTKVSFREAELGEFFDDAPNASIYYAQPDKDVGRALLAIDGNNELSELSGDGTIVYLKFIAKELIEDQAEPNFALYADTSARYILDRDGRNILPLPVIRQAFRTDTINAPAEEIFLREGGGFAPDGTPLPAADTITGGTGVAPGTTGTGVAPVLRPQLARRPAQAHR